MYQAFYGLKDHPFRLTPDPYYICMTSQHREALSGIVYNVCTRPGLMVLVGEAGTGKTTLLRSVTDLLVTRQFILARCNNPTLSRVEFYDMLLAEMGVECSSTLKNRQLSALQEMLLRKRAQGFQAILVVDEAQRLPCELLEEIRLLLNLETPREKLLQIIMAGQPELSETLARPELRQLKQRVSSICRLQPLSLDEMREYINHRLAVAGLPQQKLFPGPVMEMIFKYTQGIPRLVNSVCDGALQTGFALEKTQISESMVREVVDDLELAPVESVSRQERRAGDVSPPVEPSAKEPSAEARIPEPALNSLNGSNGSNGHNHDQKVPFESYASRQKSVGFFAQLLDRRRK